MSESKKLPLGRLGRLARMAQVGVRSGASMLLSRDGSAAADQAAEILGTMRGLAAKIGQMASYVDGLVPEQHRDAYEQALKGLRAAAPTSPPSQVRALIERELGAPVEQLFAEWDDTPIASASIGQVHHARLEDGREVAVKVQHPGIERAIETDLKNASVLEGLVSTLGPRSVNSKEVFDEIAQRFREELDYRLEAQRQQRFVELHSADPHIRIPQVIFERSSLRVITTEFVRGASLEQVAQAPPELRRHYCEVLWRFVYRGNLVGGLFNADPHPGNYLFGEDGTIAFLDYGCVQPISDARLRIARTLHRAARLRDERAFRDGVIELLETRGGEYEATVVRYIRSCFEPLFASPFHMTRQYVTQVVQGVTELKSHILGGDRSFAPLPGGMVFMSRLQFGFFSVLARLDAVVDYARVEEEFLRQAGLD
jgi:predicted unusual protein kinase regulating ubiquinone biosynthesis (AarF/ABC1/UbiB family)